jgi:hypothetical protein
MESAKSAPRKGLGNYDLLARMKYVEQKLGIESGA